MSEPREWWLATTPVRSATWRALVKPPKSGPSVHVIEYAAFAELKAENERIKTGSSAFYENLIAEQKAENKKLAKYVPKNLETMALQYGKIAELATERDQLKEEVEQLRSQNANSCGQVSVYFEMVNRQKSEIERLKAQLQMTNSNWPHEKKLHDKYDQLQAQANNLAEALMRIKMTYDDDGGNSSQAEATEALKEWNERLERLKGS